MWAFLIVDSAEVQNVLYSELAYDAADFQQWRDVSPRFSALKC